MSRYFTFEDEKSSKFWMIETDGICFTVRYGRIGSEGKESIKNFATKEIREKESEKLIAEKIKKGYVEDKNYNK